MVNSKEYQQVITSLDSWVTLKEFSKTNGVFTFAQLRHMVEHVDHYPYLDKTYRMISRRLLFNEKLFALWMANELPEQKGNTFNAQTP